jgi:hypothetical protein
MDWFDDWGTSWDNLWSDVGTSWDSFWEPVAQPEREGPYEGYESYSTTPVATSAWDQFWIDNPSYDTSGNAISITPQTPPPEETYTYTPPVSTSTTLPNYISSIGDDYLNTLNQAVSSYNQGFLTEDQINDYLKSNQATAQKDLLGATTAAGQFSEGYLTQADVDNFLATGDASKAVESPLTYLLGPSWDMPGQSPDYKPGGGAIQQAAVDKGTAPSLPKPPTVSASAMPSQPTLPDLYPSWGDFDQVLEDKGLEVTMGNWSEGPAAQVYSPGQKVSGPLIIDVISRGQTRDSRTNYMGWHGMPGDYKGTLESAAQAIKDVFGDDVWYGQGTIPYMKTASGDYLGNTIPNNISSNQAGNPAKVETYNQAMAGYNQTVKGLNDALDFSDYYRDLDAFKDFYELEKPPESTAAKYSLGSNWDATPTDSGVLNTDLLGSDYDLFGKDPIPEYKASENVDQGVDFREYIPNLATDIYDLFSLEPPVDPLAPLANWGQQMAAPPPRSISFPTRAQNIDYGALTTSGVTMPDPSVKVSGLPALDYNFASRSTQSPTFTPQYPMADLGRFQSLFGLI